MAGEISFFELGVGDVGQAQAFYGGLFGWTFGTASGGGGDGAGATIETPTLPGGLHGSDPGASPYVFFRVDDMAAALEQVRALGGSVDPVDLGSDEASAARFGRFQLCRDDQGSPFGLHQPPARSGP
ncbi:Glyoxalase-like domain protein [Streptomyces sp. YIM 130001]|uniref:VOC family protein n=1 Tax=Streptomyces sp. YIM 130001 TaxID=2259644 RepID=UPI000E655F5F|nr:VOC family protein [Streptomyces sp. YIM 130001]RII20471.1 Glyoxalase-like domain protein [Streptomyces sp. YIM 130001]